MSEEANKKDDVLQEETADEAQAPENEQAPENDQAREQAQEPEGADKAAKRPAMRIRLMQLMRPRRRKKPSTPDT